MIAQIGIGAGDYEEETVGSGLPFPPLQERYERLEEMLQICLPIFSRSKLPLANKTSQAVE